ncbi:MAG: hypothetical protein LBF26_01275 [Puniceicoccales bacterium]|jgi:hypothetical protein|nr:hypothetical protein [Puniceicoccales bacterium]
MQDNRWLPKKNFDSAVKDDKFWFMAAAVDEFKVDSIYWNLFAAERDYYYRVYKRNGGMRSRSTFFDDLFTEAYPASRYKFDCDPEVYGESRLRAYRAKAGGGYVYDPDGEFFQIGRLPDSQGSVAETFYAHRSQLFKPAEYVLRAMNIIALAMAVAFQNAQIQMAQMADYVREAEMINAKIAELNGLYSDLNLLLTSFDNYANKYAATVVYAEQKLWERLTFHGFVDLNSVVKFGIKFRPILLKIGMQGDANLGDDQDWLAYSLEYIASENRIQTHRYPRTGDVNLYKNTCQEVLKRINNTHDRNASPEYTNAEIVTKILALDNATIHFDILTTTRLAIDQGRSGVCCDTYNDQGKWQKGDEIVSHSQQYGKTDKTYNGDSRNDFQISMSRYQMEGHTITSIIDEGRDSVVRLWDVRKYVDDVRRKIEYTNNQLQTATTYMSMTNQDMQANFSTASNVIGSAGQQLGQAAKFIRI